MSEACVTILVELIARSAILVYAFSYALQTGERCRPPLCLEFAFTDWRSQCAREVGATSADKRE